LFENGRVFRAFQPQPTVSVFRTFAPDFDGRPLSPEVKGSGWKCPLFILRLKKHWFTHGAVLLAIVTDAQFNNPIADCFAPFSVQRNRS